MNIHTRFLTTSQEGKYICRQKSNEIMKRDFILKNRFKMFV